MTTTATTFDFTAIQLPDDARAVLAKAPRVIWPDSAEELIDLALGGPAQDKFEVRYDVQDKGSVLEAVVARVRNGVVVNYTEPYMRRRDPNCMVIADDLPTDKPLFKDRFGYEFDTLRSETLAWLAEQPLVAFGFHAGQRQMGVDCLFIAPANAAFFAFALTQLQGILSHERIEKRFEPGAVMYVAPPFRHTRFEGKQVVVHARRSDPHLHELFAYNLYPGPSAKKGVYGMLIHVGERERWITAHCSVVQVVTPYDNTLTIMHEGASGGGKSEMLEQAHREPDGRFLLGVNLVTKERRHLEIPRTCDLHPVADDMALCHPDLQDVPKYLRVTDAENGWFVRVNHIHDYGTDPHLEKLTAQPPEPFVFLSIDAVPKSRALIWEHTEDEPGKPCPNPRVILPRRSVPNVVDDAVTVDVRSFGVRTPPCTRDAPTYGILGLLHLLPPALAWLWRLVAPRGHDNPSVVESGEMGSEGVGSYWPFATGRRVDQANLLLEQIVVTPKVRYILCPNQHVGAWKTGFMPQWIAREYLARRGSAKFKPDAVKPSRCPLLGYSLYTLQVEGRQIPRWFLQVETQPEVGVEAYDAGAKELYDFFRKQLAKFQQPDLMKLGGEIIECCWDNGTVEHYEQLMPAQ